MMYIIYLTITAYALYTNTSRMQDAGDQFSLHFATFIFCGFMMF